VTCLTLYPLVEVVISAVMTSVSLQLQCECHCNITCSCAIRMSNSDPTSKYYFKFMQ